MADAAGKNAAGDPPEAPPSERRTASRVQVAFPVRVRYESVIDFVQTQSMNISRTGMFITTPEPAPIGSRIDFEFALSDGFTLLRGNAEVVRAVRGAVTGMGIRFLDLDEESRRLIDRIVDVNDEEGRNPTLGFDFSRPATVASMPVVGPAGVVAPPPAVVAPAAALPPQRPISFEGRNLRIALGPLSVHVFTQNPLLNVRTGGLFVPADEDVPLGTMFEVEIVDGGGAKMLAAKGKVVAKQELRVGIRLVDPDKDGLVRLRAEVAKLAPSK